jgi:hypothetical protein
MRQVWGMRPAQISCFYLQIASKLPRVSSKPHSTASIPHSNNTKNRADTTSAKIAVLA